MVHFPDWLGLPLDHDGTWAMGDPPVGYADGQPPQDFMIPSPSYAVNLQGNFTRLNAFSQRISPPLPIIPIAPTLRSMHPGGPAASITPGGTGLPTS